MICFWYHYIMKLLNKDADYATRALVLMAKHPGKSYSVPEIASELGLAGPFLRRVLQKAVKAGLLTSFKGKGGGFTMKSKPSKINLIEIIKAFQPKPSLIDCITKGKPCMNTRTCPIRKEVLEIEKTVFDRLSRITVNDLLKGNK